MERSYTGTGHRMRTKCIARRPDLALKDTAKKNDTQLLIDMACPNESNKEAKREE